MPPPQATEQCQFGPWTVTTTKCHIISSDGPDMKKYEKELEGLPHLPEMVFPNNTLRLEHTSGFGIEFNALDAIKLVDREHDLMKVACAQEWMAARAESEFIKDKAKPYDWTYTTNYKGSLFGSIKVIPTDEHIDIEKLKQREKINFYQDILLFEDELSDHGCSILNVKIRVMPTSIFILQRLYVRVDGVIVRILDTRVYHEMGWNYILREHSSRESKIPDINVPQHILTDKNEIGQHLAVKEESYEKLCFPETSNPDENIQKNSGEDKSKNTLSDSEDR